MKPALTIKYKLKITRIIYFLLMDLLIRNILRGETMHSHVWIPTWIVGNQVYG